MHIAALLSCISSLLGTFWLFQTFLGYAVCFFCYGEQIWNLEMKQTNAVVTSGHTVEITTVVLYSLDVCSTVPTV